MATDFGEPKYASPRVLHCPSMLGVVKAKPCSPMLAVLGHAPHGACPSARLRAAARVRRFARSLELRLRAAGVGAGRPHACRGGARHTKGATSCSASTRLLELVRTVGPLVRLGRHDADPRQAMPKALSSAPLNVAEGMYNRGKNRPARYHTALGSLRETLACFEVAAALRGTCLPSLRGSATLSHHVSEPSRHPRRRPLSLAPTPPPRRRGAEEPRVSRTRARLRARALAFAHARSSLPSSARRRRAHSRTRATSRRRRAARARSTRRTVPSRFRRGSCPWASSGLADVHVAR